MSENDNPSPSPSKQTSSVPLKKETVRVTLKAADAPPAIPSATVPLAPPVRPPIPPTATVPAPAPTIPLRAAGAPTAKPAPAPTIPLRTAGAPGTKPAPAPTIPLRTSGPPTAGAAPTIRLATSTTPIGSPLKTSAAPSLPGTTPTLPKATIQLQPPTAPMGGIASPSQAATLQLAEEEEEEAGGGLVKILAGVGFGFAIILLVVQFLLASVWIKLDDPRGSSFGAADDWSRIIQSAAQ